MESSERIGIQSIEKTHYNEGIPLDDQIDNTIDFDFASKEWRKNKIKLSNGYFRYKCKKCDEYVYRYVFENKYFQIFATDFDIRHQNHKNKDIYCEDHLLCDDED
jgi:hypothetical protein